jgi:hypothetical protein
MFTEYLEQMFVCGGFCIWICAEFKWKSTIIAPLDLAARPANADDETPRLIAQLHLEITLTGEVPPGDKKDFVKQPTINKDHLTDDAFRPKSFSVRIETGYFATPTHLSHPSATWVRDKVWTKRLVFDNSPFPPASEWKEDAYWGTCDPEGGNCWDDKEFVAYYSPKQKHLDSTSASAGVTHEVVTDPVVHT